MQKARAKAGTAKKTAPPRDVAAYLAGVAPEMRPALERLRGTIRAAAPKAVEVISYGIPTFRLGRGLVAYAAFKNHCSFFPMSALVLRSFKSELAAFPTSAGTIRFTPDSPIPAALVRRIVRARIREIAARDGSD